MHKVISIIYAAFSLALLFSGYGIVSSIITSSYHKIGFYSHVLIFTFNIFGSILSPFIVYNIFGIKWTIIIGASTYVLILGVFNLSNDIIMLIVSAINGFGAALMRSQQNTWISSQPIEDNKGLYIGIFNSIYGLNGIIGSLVAVLMILIFKINITTLVWILFSISLTALIMLCFIKPVTLNETHNISLKLYLNLLVDTNLLLLYPLICYQAASIVYSFAIMALLFNGDTFLISLNFLIYSTSFCVMSYIFGYLYKHSSLMIFLISNMISSLLLAAYVILMHIYMPDNIHVYLVTGLLSGFNDSAINFVILTIFNEWYNHAKAIYGYHRAVYSLFSSILVVICPFMVWYVPFIYSNVFIISSVICYYFFLVKMNNKKEEKVYLLSEIL